MKKRPPIFERIRAGLQECLEDAQGTIALKTITIPTPPPEIDGKTLAALRKSTAMSQEVFAKLLSVSRNSVNRWELGLRPIPESTRRFLEILTQQPALVGQITGVPNLSLSNRFEVKTTKGQNRLIAQTTAL